MAQCTLAHVFARVGAGCPGGCRQRGARGQLPEALQPRTRQPAGEHAHAHVSREDAHGACTGQSGCTCTCACACAVLYGCSHCWCTLCFSFSS